MKKTTIPSWNLSTSLKGCLVKTFGNWQIRDETSNPMRPVFREIQAAIDHKLFWLAITSALAIPGMCSALESKKHWSGRDEYKIWFERYLSNRFEYLTADDCYSLRCGVVHKGTVGSQKKGKPYQRVIFTLPGNITIGQGLFNDILMFDTVRFCEQIIEACDDWYLTNENQEIVLFNSSKIFRYREDGLRPLVNDVGTIA